MKHIVHFSVCQVMQFTEIGRIYFGFMLSKIVMDFCHLLNGLHLVLSQFSS